MDFIHYLKQYLEPVVKDGFTSSNFNKIREPDDFNQFSFLLHKFGVQLKHILFPLSLKWILNKEYKNSVLR